VPRPCLADFARQGGDFDFQHRKSTSPPGRKERDKVGAPANSVCQGLADLQFKVTEQDYFLAFVEQERRWYVFAPTAQGLHRIPVYVDAENYEKWRILETETTLSS
jgi:hypothetical protein